MQLWEGQGGVYIIFMIRSNMRKAQGSWNLYSLVKKNEFEKKTQKKTNLKIDQLLNSYWEGQATYYSYIKRGDICIIVNIYIFFLPDIRQTHQTAKENMYTMDTIG